MPFQDVDDVSPTEFSRAPGAIEQWLRRVLVDDWGLKLLALGIALALWFAVTGANKPVTIHTAIQLNFIRPVNLDLSNDPPRSVDAILTGRRAQLNRISQLDLVATVDLSDQRAGEHVVRLPDRVQMDLPEGIKIQGFLPSTLSIRLEPILQRDIGVDVKLTGKLGAGYEVYGVHTTPTSVSVRGPDSNVRDLEKAPTESISLEGRTETFAVPAVGIDITDHKVNLLTPTVEVNVEIGERREEKSFAVRVNSAQGTPARPPQATVTVFGPASLLASLHPEDLRVVLDANSEGILTPRLEMPLPVQGVVTLRAIRPSQFSLPR